MENWTTLLAICLAAVPAQEKQTKEDRTGQPRVIPVWPPRLVALEQDFDTKMFNESRNNPNTFKKGIRADD
jgi:hypothetical protein